jgi:Zn-dependent protease with chaperone function
MNASNFFDSYIGAYVAQAFSHSLIAALVVDRAVQSWKIASPVIRQRFSFIVMVFPILSFPLYQTINPERGSISFRLETLFDVNRWLNLELWGKIPVNLLFILMLSLTSLIFLFQEIIPILKHMLESRKSSQEGEDTEEEQHNYPVIESLLKDFPGERPRISLIEDDELILFSTTGKTPAVFLSTGLIEALSNDEIQAAVAHELAHITRSKRPLMILLYLMRILMFFNPVILVEFRRIVQEEEKICDDVAVAMTGKPAALAGILKKFSRARGEVSPDNVKKISSLSVALEDYSHSVHMESRIKRLEDGSKVGTDGEWFKFLLTLFAVSAINYFVV